MIIDNTVYDILSSIGYEDFGEKLKEQDLRFEKAANLINRADGFLSSIPEDADHTKLATVFLIRILPILRSGRALSSLSDEEWDSILGDTKSIAVDLDPSRYSAFVFVCWAKAIGAAKENLKERVTERILTEIENSLAILNVLINDYNEGSVGEIKFIEESLEICLQAVTYILTAYAEIAVPEWSKDLIDSIGIFAFELGRYKHYAEEHRLLLEWEAHRNALTEDLRIEFENYYAALRSNIEMILELMDQAISTDPTKAFKGSAKLAEALGLKNDRLLTIEDVDDFFL